MTTLDSILPALPRLTDSERAELNSALDKLGPPHVSPNVGAAHSMPDHPSVVSTPGVCGGSPRLIRTRIPVWLLEVMRVEGQTVADILDDYPTLCESDVTQAWSYADHHREEILREIKEQEEA